MNARRNIRMADRQSSQTYVLGYAANMPLIMPNTTSLGISGTSLVELRNTGKTQLSLIYDAKLSLFLELALSVQSRREGRHRRIPDHKQGLPEQLVPATH